jgi:predicted ester cyclase
MPNENKELVRHGFERVLASQTFEGLEDLFHPDFIDHGALPGLPPGIAGLRELLARQQAEFPDLEATIEDMIAEGDKVVTRWTMTATHRPTQRKLTWSAIGIVRVADGKVIERWGSSDLRLPNAVEQGS